MNLFFSFFARGHYWDRSLVRETLVIGSVLGHNSSNQIYLQNGYSDFGEMLYFIVLDYDKTNELSRIIEKTRVVDHSEITVFHANFI